MPGRLPISDEERKTRRLERSRRWKRGNSEKVRAQKAAWRAANPEKCRASVLKCYHQSGGREKQLWAKRLKLYGLTPDSFYGLLELQQGRCPVCSLALDPLSTETAVDHDHVTGRVRGLLHRPCNVALGMLQDDPKNCHRAAAYLEGVK